MLSILFVAVIMVGLGLVVLIPLVSQYKRDNFL